MTNGRNYGEFIKKAPDFLPSFKKAFDASLAAKYGNYLQQSRLKIFFSNMKEALDRSLKHKKREAPYFNPFVILKVKRRELSATAMWQDLLNPNGSHEQKSLFLKYFLQLVDDKLYGQAGMGCFEFALVEPMSAWEIYAEFFIHRSQNNDPNGRIDIYLKHKFSNAAIAIEYKIDANDQPEQMRRYHEHLNKFTNAQAIYIHPTGKRPSDISLDGLGDGDYLCISIKHDLIPMLKKILRDSGDVPITVRSFIENYIEVAK